MLVRRDCYTTATLEYECICYMYTYMKVNKSSASSKPSLFIYLTKEKG